MEYKLFGRAVDVDSALLSAITSKKEVVWIGNEQAPIQLVRQLKEIGIAVYPSEFVFGVKSKIAPEDMDGAWKSGRVWAMGWLPPRDPKSAQAPVFISATRLCLLPWLEMVGADVFSENWKGAIPSLKFALIEAMSSPDNLQPGDLSSNVLAHGCINYEHATKEQVMGLAWAHYLSKGPWASIHGLATWSEASWEETEDGEPVLGDPKGIAWLLMPRSEIGYRGPLGEWRARTKVACGFVEPSMDGLSIAVREQPAPTLWRSQRALIESGVPVILEEKSRGLFANGEIKNGQYSILLGGTKLAKLPARPKMDTGVQARLNPAFHETTLDFAKMRTNAGEDIPFQQGLIINTVISNFTGWASSGVAPCRLEFHTLSERVLRGQLTNDQAAALALDGLIGQTFEPWKPVAGPIVNSVRFPFTVTGSKKEKDESDEFWNVTIYGHIAECSPVVKLRGPAKAQTFPFDGIRGFEFPWPQEWEDADLLLGAEELKLPKLAGIRGWANAMRREVILTEGGEWLDPQDEVDFLEWYDANKKTISIKVRLGNPKVKRYQQMLEVLKLAGRQVDDDGYLHAEVTYVIAPLVFGIESIPASIRGGKTALTPAMHLSSVMTLRNVMQASGDSMNDMIYNQVWDPTKISDLTGVVNQGWSEFVRQSKKAYPNGSVIKFIKPSGVEDVFIDWRVVELFSHGDVSPDDTFTVMVRRFLYHYHKAAIALKASGSQPWDQPTGELESKEWIEWQKNWKVAASTLPRLRGAMAGLGFSAGMLRRMASPARITPFLVSVGLHSIPKGVVMVHPDTVNDMNIPFTRKGETMLMRFPNDAFAPVRLNMSRRAPKGVILCSTWDQQVGTKGDSDGDMNLVADRWTLGALINMSRKDRELIARYFRMMGWNSAIRPKQPIELPKVEFATYWPEEANEVNHRVAFDRYQMFTPLENTPIVDWNRAVPEHDMRAPLVTTFDIDAYCSWGEQISRFNTSGIGHSYNVWFAATMMMSLSFKRNWDTYRVWASVAHLAATLYEDVFLAAGPKANQWTLFELLEKGDRDDLDKWHVALEDLGFSKISKLAISTKDGNDVEIDLVEYLIIARNIVSGYQSHFSNGWMTKRQKETLGSYEKYAPTVGLLRAILSFRMKPAWMASYPTDQEIVNALSLIHPGSPIMAYYGDTLLSLYPYAVECARAQVDELYARSMEV